MINGKTALSRGIAKRYRARFVGSSDPTGEVHPPPGHNIIMITHFMYFVYLLLLSNKQIYTGFSEDLKERLLEHNRGNVESTRHKRPLKIIHCEVYKEKDDAMRRERFLKTTEGRRFLYQQLKILFTKLGVKRGVAQQSKALGSGPRDRECESPHPEFCE